MPAVKDPAPESGLPSSLVGSDVVLDIHALDATGAGVGSAVDPGAQSQQFRLAFRVPFALPGEQVLARIWRVHGQDAETDLATVTRASPSRVVPECALFGACGGCQVQHLAPAEQLAWKAALVRTAFDGAGLAPWVRECIPSPRAYGYRSKLTPHYEVPRHGQGQGQGQDQDQGHNATVSAPAIGFLRAGRRHAIVDVPHCPIATDGINAALPALRTAALAEAPSRRRGASLLLREGANGVTSNPDAPVVERASGLTLEFAAREFFQNNPFLLPALVEFVVDHAAATGARLLVDTYSGSGLFALAAARRFDRVVGVEVSTAAVAAARANAARNGLVNVEFLAAPAARIFASVMGQGRHAAVIVDPPRKGADASFLAQLVAFAPGTVVYVSCNPETAARDVAQLAASGFTVTTIQPFDMFPQTRHVECVTVLERR